MKCLEDNILQLQEAFVEMLKGVNQNNKCIVFKMISKLIKKY